jgi:hypothetical protein
MLVACSVNLFVLTHVACQVLLRFLCPWRAAIGQQSERHKKGNGPHNQIRSSHHTKGSVSIRGYVSIVCVYLFVSLRLPQLVYGRKLIETTGETYKLEILQSIKTEPITVYGMGTAATNSKPLGFLWWDLCAGPHLASTGQLQPKAIELQSVAGAYWRGDEKQPMLQVRTLRQPPYNTCFLMCSSWLQRIYGTAWLTEEQLQAYRLKQEEARRRDHRALGKALDLFYVQEDAGGGLVFWHPKGAVVRQLIEDFWRSEHVKVRSRLDVCPLTFLNSELLLYRAATTSCTHRTSPTWTSGRPRGTSTSTAQTCSNPWTWTDTSTSSSP